MQNGEHCIPLGDETLFRYSILLHQWTHVILLTIDGHDSDYKFSLTEDDLNRASILKKALQQSPTTFHIDIFHNFIKPFRYPKCQGQSEGSYTKWNNVVQGCRI